MKASELIGFLQQHSHLDQLEVVVDAVGITGVIGGRGGKCPKIKSVGVGIDHDSGFVFLFTEPKVYLKFSK